MTFKIILSKIKRDSNRTEHIFQLLLIAGSGSVDIAQMLINRGADIEAIDKRNKTPLHWASESGRTQMVRYLVEEGAEKDAVSYNNSTPMHLALTFAFVETATCLVDLGANTNIKDFMNETPYEMAFAKGFQALVNYIDTRIEMDFE